MRIVLLPLLLLVLFSCDPSSDDPNIEEEKKQLWTGPITDIDGNVYNTVIIGEKVWTVENLRVTKYNDGTTLSLKNDSAEWCDATSGAYCYPNGASTNVSAHGLLYNNYAIRDGKLAPKGWHVSTTEDWQASGFILNGLLKDTVHWISPNSGATNSTGFSARGSGFRFENSYEKFGETALFWTPNLYPGTGFHYGYWLNTYNEQLNVGVSYGDNYGLSVRLVKDTE